MLTGEIRNQIDRIWDAFWSGCISNPRGPDGVFSSGDVDTLVSVLKDIRGHAAA